MGQLVFQATAGGQVALVGPNPSSNFSLNVPDVNSTLATLAAQTFTGQQTDTVDASINGLTVGKGGGSVTGNSVLGYQALNNNTTASNNTAVGYQAGYNNTTGAYNTYLGYQSGSFTASGTGGYNSGVGVYALYSNTSGTYNSAFGHDSLANNTTGSYNTALGNYALISNTTASNNTAVGYQAGYYVTTGVQNIILGSGTATTLTTGNNNVIIGYTANASSAGVGQSIAIGYGAVDKGSTTGMISPNGGGVYQGNNSATWSITSDARLKKNIVDNTTGLSAITAIQVRNFEYRTKDEVTELPSQNAIEISGVQLGAIAQEIQAILPECVKTESTGVMSVDTTNLTWYLINAVKELNAKITALEAKLGA